LWSAVPIRQWGWGMNARAPIYTSQADRVIHAITLYMRDPGVRTWADAGAVVGWISRVKEPGRAMAQAVRRFRAKWDDDAAAMADLMRRSGEPLHYVAAFWGVSPWTMGARLRYRGYEYKIRPNGRRRRMSDERLAVALAGGEMHDAGGVSWDACAVAVGWDVEKAHRGRTLRSTVKRLRGGTL